MSITLLQELTSADQLDQWLTLGATYPVLYDVNDQVARKTFGVDHRPVFFLIDRDMTILAYDEGPLGMEHIEHQVRDILNSE